MGVIRKEVDLTNDEKQYLLAVERGDVPSTRQYLSMGVQTGLNINCVDPLGRTALLVAIENENIEMIEVLLSYNVELGDALLHAITEENVEAVELLLNHEVATKGEAALHQSVPSSSFTPDITPIILAAHRDNYEIIKLLLDRGYRIPKPHDVRCNCKNCKIVSSDDSLRHSRSRINAYRALASPSLIALSSKDPILTSFELSWELKRLSKLENEFKIDYEKLAKKCQEFAVDLLDQIRGSKELEIILNHDSSNPNDYAEQEPQTGDKMRLSRLKLAIKFKQKKFVAHPNCQQLLASLWYEGLPGFRRHNIVARLSITVIIGIVFPLLSIFYLIAPKSRPGKLLRKPFIKFICHSAAYITFLVLLILVSQRVTIPIPGVASQTSDIEKIKMERRGAPATMVEWMILAYVAGLIWTEIKQLWDEGAHEYVRDMWNILDFVTNSLYIATLTLRVIAYLQVRNRYLASDFNFTNRYIDDVLSISNPKFADYLSSIYHSELEVKETTETNNSASYLDIMLSYDTDGHMNTSVYDKRDDFNFSITNFPFLSSNIPSSPAYGVFISQLMRYARARTKYTDFVLRAWRLSDKPLSQGYVQKEIAENNPNALAERKDWNPYDPNLIAEALFAAANIFSSLKLIYIFTVNPHLGPLQISLGRMILDIMKFAVLYVLVLFSFACGLNHLYWYYATLREEECKVQNKLPSCDRKYKSFANLFEILQSLYWSIYGLVDLDHAELTDPDHDFTEFVGKLMFGSYSWIAFVVLLNLLIATMSNSYQHISSQADEEWKFARSRLWMSYFEDSGTLPAPFNIIPSPKTFYYLITWFRSKICVCSKDQKRNRWQSIRKIVKKINEREIRYQNVMRDLIKRYIMQKQRGPLRGEGVTEDDVSEIKQDISSFRYELLEILRNNGMKTPNPNQPKPTSKKMRYWKQLCGGLSESFDSSQNGFPTE
ncbi:hypothetical protein FSP39_006161 [Pinctada imbricata]|uniref:Transient receptor ion channel domain-containing protein n=1 Tax=Pinctada imbricata TaxID=66713 RepID=A0AA88YHL6_PINIB|nr:hypothetical protein FSP39_006161 [Pinctada imbricata]